MRNSHLPQHCEVLLVEIDLRKLVSKDTLDQFRSELNRRTKRRKALERKAALTAQSESDAREAVLLQHQDLKVLFVVFSMLLTLL